MATMVFRRAGVPLVAALAAVALSASPAQANVGISTSMTVPVGTGVGSTGSTGTVTVQNTSTPPQNDESLSVTSIRLAPSCGSTPPARRPTPASSPFAVRGQERRVPPAAAGASLSPHQTRAVSSR